MNKVLLFNPRSAETKPRIPNSILAVAASIEGSFDYAIVDGNLENNPWTKLEKYLSSGEFGYFGCTVMPGPQLKQAIPFTKKIRNKFPSVKIIWGGYLCPNRVSRAFAVTLLKSEPHSYYFSTTNFIEPTWF